MVWEYFDDGRPPRWHTHPIRPIPGKRPRPPDKDVPMVTREDWIAAPRLIREDDVVLPLKHPVPYVRFTYTDTWRCENRKECLHLVWSLQDNHRSKYTYDIMWNFLIAPDGSVYEGRGWEVDAHRPDIEKYHKLTGRCIDIAYIGNYIATPLPKVMKDAAYDLIDWGVNHGKINCCFESIPHTDPLYPVQMPEETAKDIIGEIPESTSR